MRLGRSVMRVSRHPSLKMIVGCPARSAAICDPHFEQKRRTCRAKTHSAPERNRRIRMSDIHKFIGSWRGNRLDQTRIVLPPRREGRQIRGLWPSHDARVLEVRIHLPPAESQQTFGSSAPAFHRASAAVAPMIVGHDVIFRGAGGRKSDRQEDRGRVYGRGCCAYRDRPPVVGERHHAQH